jgi:hypothetical protein
MSDLTHVELLWHEKRIERWIRFGRIAEEHVIDRSRRVASFAPGSILACARCRRHRLSAGRIRFGPRRGFDDALLRPTLFSD